MNFLPVFMDIRGQRCLVVGGGETAARKAALLLQCGAQVTVVAPELVPAFTELKDQDRLAHRKIGFELALLDEVALVICASGDDDLDRMVSQAARDRHLPVNVADRPELCSFVLPAIIDRSPLLVAVSSGGAAPVLARLLRARLETLIPSSYGRLALLAASFRDEVKKKFSLSAKRRMFWEKVLQGPIAELVYAGNEAAAEAALKQQLDEETDDLPQGEVYLVGGGPGNPDLLTFRALRLMQQADVVIYDHLVADAVLDMCRRDAERVYVGKERANHTMQQEGINQLLVRYAQQGKRVLRLKGGDPFIFGRGGEEIETLSENGIPFQVVPGITAASGVASYAGIPLTHRDYAQSCVFVTGHLKDDSINLDWDALARPNQTVVIYMGLLGLPILCKELISHGLPAATPVAIVQQGTTVRQRVLVGTLETLPALATEAEFKPPTLIIVGNVVKLHEKLAWFRTEACNKT
ncbi:siroheme synthase [Sulfuriferula multivorans]|uniref:Siroheme synthase n=1 Tax=Sulfuriferula multivorans TaxID=1559896 RepID=A0A401JE55_9PROT|nr:siroheme synthase CysG [Sulfuriferula multivorans]GBL45884.1 siroheme synthase [Sulfuriferula multivorans]